MKAFSLSLAFLCASIAVASSGHHSPELAARHASLAARQSPADLLLPRGPVKRRSCSGKAKSSKAASTHTSTSSPPKPTTNETKVTPAPPTKGLINVKSQCGSIGASRVTTKRTGPNGDIGWLNCGIEGSGWRPPYITIDDIITVSLDEAFASSNNAFKPCAPYLSHFKGAAAKYGLRAVQLTSIAMQESGCNPSTTGGAGEAGLMQLTHINCGGAPGGNCYDVKFNIYRGAELFKRLLDENDGSLLIAIGRYNGWYPGLTEGKATAARWTPCCRCQNNLDYLHQTVNGWYRNINAYSAKLGVYNNLDVCH